MLQAGRLIKAQNIIRRKHFYLLLHSAIHLPPIQILHWFCLGSDGKKYHKDTRSVCSHIALTYIKPSMIAVRKMIFSVHWEAQSVQHQLAFIILMCQFCSEITSQISCHFHFALVSRSCGHPSLDPFVWVPSLVIHCHSCWMSLSLRSAPQPFPWVTSGNSGWDLSVRPDTTRWYGAWRLLGLAEG